MKRTTSLGTNAESNRCCRTGEGKLVRFRAIPVLGVGAKSGRWPPDHKAGAVEVFSGSQATLATGLISAVRL